MVVSSVRRLRQSTASSDANSNAATDRYGHAATDCNSNSETNHHTATNNNANPIGNNQSFIAYAYRNCDPWTSESAAWFLLTTCDRPIFGGIESTPQLRGMSWFQVAIDMARA